MNGTISETKDQGKSEQEGYSTSVTWIFGMITILGIVNLICCTPIYLGMIGWLAGKVMGE